MTNSAADEVRYEAEVNWPVIRRLLFVALGIGVFFAARSYYARHLEQQAVALEEAMFQVQLGMPIDEAAALMGRPPDQVETGQAVFANRGATLYDVSNPLAARYGPPFTYTYHLWRVAPVSAAVFTDSNGIVIRRVSRRDRRLPTRSEKFIRWCERSLMMWGILD